MYIIIEEGVRRTDDDAGILPTHVFVSGQVVMPLLGLETFLSPTSHSQVRILRQTLLKRRAYVASRIVIVL